MLNSVTIVLKLWGFDWWLGSHLAILGPPPMVPWLINQSTSLLGTSLRSWWIEYWICPSLQPVCFTVIKRAHHLFRVGRSVLDSVVNCVPGSSDLGLLVRVSTARNRSAICATSFSCCYLFMTRSFSVPRPSHASLFNGEMIRHTH
jgi:hypothetical protein